MKQLLLLSLLLTGSAFPLPNINGFPGLPGLPGLPDWGDIIPGFPDPGDGSNPSPSPTPDPNPDPDPTIPPQAGGYILTWHDEFTLSGSSGGGGYLPASSSWLFDTGTSYPGGAAAWGNNELQTYTTSEENIRLTEDGVLQITPRLSSSNSSNAEAQWTSARIETTSTFSAEQNGKLYIESRLRTGCAPGTQQAGIWSAFWALGESFRSDPTYWPMASEWDLVEVINGDPTVYNTLHCGTDSNEGGPCNEYTGLGNGGVSWSGCEWHVSGFEVDRTTETSGGRWEGETLSWYLDGTQTHTVSGADVGDEEVWESIAHQGHFLLLNVAVGGNWPGYPNERTVDGESVGMQVDYVRVWGA